MPEQSAFNFSPTRATPLVEVPMPVEVEVDGARTMIFQGYLPAPQDFRVSREEVRETLAEWRAGSASVLWEGVGW